MQISVSPALARFAFAAVVAGAFTGALLAPRSARAEWKNVQVLPKDMPKDQLKAVMKAQSHALGVECDYCHDMPDADKDTAKKKIAREMMKMENDINTKFLKGMDKKVTCETCHRGKETPEVTGK